MSLRIEIGPAGEPPTTTFYYLDGLVTLYPRPETIRTVAQVASLLIRIDAFAKGARAEFPAASWSAPSKYDSRTSRAEDDPGHVVCKFYCFEKFEQITTIDIAAQLVTFAERTKARTMIWSDFEAYVRHLKEILALARRPPPP